MPVTGAAGMQPDSAAVLAEVLRRQQRYAAAAPSPDTTRGSSSSLGSLDPPSYSAVTVGGAGVGTGAVVRDSKQQPVAHLSPRREPPGQRRYRAQCGACTRSLDFEVTGADVGTVIDLVCDACNARTPIRVEGAAAPAAQPVGHVMGMPLDMPAGAARPLPPAGYGYVPSQFQTVQLSIGAGPSGMQTIYVNGAPVAVMAPAASAPAPAAPAPPRDDPSWNGVIVPGLYRLAGHETVDKDMPRHAPTFLLTVNGDKSVVGEAETAGVGKAAVNGSVDVLGKPSFHITLKLRTLVGTRTYNGICKARVFSGQFFSGASYKATDPASRGTFQLQLTKLIP